ncbi:MAG: SPFH domain-containing protein [Clostridia bacterium]|nr:SPFH domain-containing protein [Clostridia bacterium]
MGLFSRIKKQTLKVVEWTDNSTDVIVYKFPLSDRYALMKGSQLVVRESQEAIFVNEGKIADVFPAGRYELDTKNLPVLTKLLSWKYAFETPFTGDIYFVNTKQFTGLKWGTQNPVMMRDKDFGMIRLRGYGVYAFRVVEPETFMREVFGTMRSYSTLDIQDYLKKIIVSSLTDAIAESQIPALDLARSYDEIGEFTKKKLGEKFSEYGLRLTNLVVENLSLPEEVEKSMDTRTSMGVMGDKMGTFTQYQTAKAIGDAARNPSGGAGAGMGIGAGFGFGGMMAKTISDSMNTVSDKKQEELTVTCTKCGAEVRKNAKFCPECGQKMVSGKTCTKCGALLKSNAKFCSECGTPCDMKKTCECGATLDANEKFCPECGKPV